MKSVETSKRIGSDMKNIDELKQGEGVRETVETVPFVSAGGHTSLKRGVNERVETVPSVLRFDHSSLKRGVNETRNTRLAFTLIELLIVIAIMAILAALIFPVTGAVNRHKLRSRTRAELRSIETAIIDYKTKKGYYPPDNPNGRYFINSLYYELSGMVLNNGVYTTLDGNASLNQLAVETPPGAFGPAMRVTGFMNTTKGSGDEGMAAQKFIRELKPAQVAELKNGVKILVGSVGWPPNLPWQPIPWINANPNPGPALKPGLTPVCYVSTNPTNNPNSFDLWIDIIVQGKTNRISNWSEDAIVLSP
jgi:prepilin-type N-terminal cleavage/methylation domain-containing protein